ncbi:MAG: methyltransferase domain-containing protein [Verrucomicrobiota bacterium]
MSITPSAQEAVDERYYRHAGSISFARRVSSLARRRVHELFMQRLQPKPGDRILDIGVSDETEIEANMLEQLYPDRENITCASLSDGKSILSAYPGVQHVQIRAGEPLPFSDNAFDIVYSNAVIEHTGSGTDQRKFIAEMCRVAPRRFLVAPNRMFPIEHHTGLPLVHYLPKAWFRKLLRGTRYDIWSYEENLNYVSASDLRAMWPGNDPTIVYSGIGFGRWKSNLVAYSSSK